MAASKPKTAAEKTVTLLITLVTLALIVGVFVLFIIWHQENPQSSPGVNPVPEVSKDANTELRELAKSQIKRQANDPYALGKVDAPVVVVEYSDYRCPYCVRFHKETMPALQPLIEQGILRFEWRDMPVVGGEQSVMLVAAAQAAAEQGKFWPFHDGIFAAATMNEKKNWTETEVLQVAKEAGVPDLERLKLALEDENVRAKIVEQTDKTATDLGIFSAPNFIINDEGFAGALPTKEFLMVIKQKYKEATGQFIN